MDSLPPSELQCYELDEKLVDRLQQPIDTSWQHCAQDLEDYEQYNNLDAIEIAIDANRLNMLADDPEADKIISDVIRKFGYQEVLQFLDTNIQVY